MKIYYNKEYDDNICDVVIYIKNNYTNRTRKFPYILLEDPDITGYPTTWIWSEGNFSCDCNRQLFFNRANNEEEEQCPCGEGKFSVNIINPENGEYLYKEF